MDSEEDVKVFSMLDSSLKSGFNCYCCERKLIDSDDFYFLNLVSFSLCGFSAAHWIQICSHPLNYAHAHNDSIFMKKDLDIVSENLWPILKIDAHNCTHDIVVDEFLYLNESVFLENCKTDLSAGVI